MKSERVVRLLASCIRSSSRKLFGRDLSEGDAVDLARVHTLQSAVKSISEKMDVFESIANRKTRFDMAVVEAKLVSGNAAVETRVQHVLAARQASFGLLRSSEDGYGARRSNLLALNATASEIISWSASYDRLLRELYDLYRSTEGGIAALSLTPQLQARALSELSGIILDAVVGVGNL